MSEEHKRALAKGRRQARAVRDYLEALDKGRNRRSQADEDALRKRVAEINEKIDEEQDPARRVELIQRRLDYQQQLDEVADEPDFEDLEKRFVEVAKEYSERKGISYMAWREEGVPAKTLREAGIPRTRRTA